jgi:hypothetical protein
LLKEKRKRFIPKKEKKKKGRIKYTIILFHLNKEHKIHLNQEGNYESNCFFYEKAKMDFAE